MSIRPASASPAAQPSASDSPSQSKTPCTSLAGSVAPQTGDTISLSERKAERAMLDAQAKAAGATSHSKSNGTGVDALARMFDSKTAPSQAFGKIASTPGGVEALGKALSGGLTCADIEKLR